jgi:hypothetical protein
LKVCLGLFSKCTGTLLDQDEDRSCKEDHSNKEKHAALISLKFRLSDNEEFFLLLKRGVLIRYCKFN